MKEKVEAFQRLLGFTFVNKNLLEQALTHKSAHHHHNERLEYLGDAILNFVVADLLFQQFITATEGELTRARASLVNKSTLYEIAMELTLGDYLNLGLGEQRSGGGTRQSILADALEALIGAIYLDAGIDRSRACVQTWLSNRIHHLKPEAQEKDPKTRLQEWLQAHHKPLPKYEIISVVGEPHSQVFTVGCLIENFMHEVQGSGTSRRIAEQQAARKILESIHDNGR